MNISLEPVSFYTLEPSYLTIMFLLENADFFTNLSFRIILPDEFIRISGSLSGHIGLIQRAQVEQYKFEVFCEKSGEYEIEIIDISYKTRTNKELLDSDRVLIVSVLENQMVTKASQNRLILEQSQLYDFMMLHFDMEEIRTILFKLEIDPETFPNNGKSAYIREVIKFCKRNSSYDRLVALVRESRKNIEF